MKMLSRLPFLLLALLMIVSCSSDDGVGKDEEKPTITINYADGFPQACEELKRGETYTFRAMVTDNLELAAYSLEIHHNFDHHTHDDQEGECDLDPKKQAIKPMKLLENDFIPEGQTSYEIQITLAIPSDVDTGDYHCAYSVTDITGWQSRTSVDIKIVD